jgi:hypothetical protein
MVPGCNRQAVELLLFLGALRQLFLRLLFRLLISRAIFQAPMILPDSSAQRGETANEHRPNFHPFAGEWFRIVDGLTGADAPKNCGLLVQCGQDQDRHRLVIAAAAV